MKKKVATRRFFSSQSLAKPGRKDKEIYDERRGETQGKGISGSDDGGREGFPASL
jgi:hypothetical protein